ncbi:MAG: restriction endonuclease subunit S [Spirochaetia bacterium]|nr:restriction endonuclease subunit S [Spirochaetia bacterium]
MKNDWEIKKLGEVCEINIGRTPERGNFKMWDKEKKTENVWLSIADLNNTENGYISDSTEYVSDNAVPKMKLVKANTLLMSFKLTIGRCAITKRDLFTNEAIAALPILDKNLDLFFLKYYLENFDWAKLTEGDVKVKGKTLNKEKLKEVPITIPPLEEQKRIVKILDEKFAMLETVKANAKANLQNAKDLFQSQLTKAFSNTTWEMQKLSEITEVKDGTHDSPSYYSEGIPFVTQKNITPSGFDLTNTKRISLQDHEKFYKRSNVEYGDILIAMIGANRGMSCIVNTREVFSIKNVGLIKKSKKTNQEYLAYYLKSEVAQKYVSDASNGGAQEFIGLTSLRKFPIPLPPLSEQKRIVKELDTLSEKTKALQDIYKKILLDCDELKQAFLQKAFEGEL